MLSYGDYVGSISLQFCIPDPCSFPPCFCLVVAYLVRIFFIGCTKRQFEPAHKMQSLCIYTIDIESITRDK
jgi:hypothetical protein